VGAVALAFVLWPRAEEEPAPVANAGPVLEIAAESDEEVVLTRAARAALLDVAQRFLTSAVVRSRVGESWELAHPDLRQGLTRREWTTGDIPVVPYPVDSARWRLGYSYVDRVGLEVYVLPRPGARVEAMVFDMELKPLGSGDGRRWRVASWVPRSSGVRQPPPPSPERAAAERRAQAEAEDNMLGAGWLLAPIAAFLGVLALPVFLGLRDRRRYRRGERLHEQHRAGLPDD
jgi:hypothetical protein